jgi:hypothetical protein
MLFILKALGASLGSAASICRYCYVVVEVGKLAVDPVGRGTHGDLERFRHPVPKTPAAHVPVLGFEPARAEGELAEFQVAECQFHNLNRLFSKISMSDSRALFTASSFWKTAATLAQNDI